jgi:hypothetical protein
VAPLLERKQKLTPFAMKHLFCTLLISLLSLGANAQKIAVRQNLMTVDGQPYARLQANGGALTSDQFYVNSLQGDRLFVVKLLTFNDPANASGSNPTGSTSYLQYVFPATGQIAETALPSLFRALSLARQLYPARLLKNGALDPQAVTEFVFVNGTPFSTRRQALDQPALLAPLGY